MSKIEIKKILGGGESWYYLLVDDKCTDSSHEDDKKGMQRLRDKRQKLERNEE